MVPKRCLSPGLDVIYTVSAIGKTIHGKPFSVKNYAKYKNSLGVGKFHTLVTGLRVCY